MGKTPEKISPKKLSEATAGKNLGKKPNKERVAVYIKKTTIEYELELRKLQHLALFHAASFEFVVECGHSNPYP